MMRAFIFGLLALLAGPAAAAQILVYGDLARDRDAAPGQTYEEVVAIHNPTEEPQQARLYLRDYAFAADGTNAYDEPGSRPRSNAAWVTFAPPVLTVPPGETIPVTLIRDGSRRTVNVTVGTRPSAEELAQAQMFGGDDEDEDAMSAELDGGEFLAEKLGIGVVPISPQIARQLGVAPDTTGLAIAGVDRNSDAARKGLQRRDIILSANYRPVSSTQQLEGIVREAVAEGRSAVVLRIQRARGQAGYFAVRIQE